MEDVEVLQLLPGGGEQDGHSGDLAHRQRRAAAGIAVQLGQHHAGEAHAGAERLGGGDGVLAGHRIEDEQRLVGLHGVADRGRLRHQHIVDTQPAGGVDDDDVEVLGLGLGQSGRGHRHRVTRAGALGHGGVGGGSGMRREHAHAGALADDLELGDRTRALQVTGHQQRGVAFAAKPVGQLAGQCGLARTLQTGQHDHRRRGLGKDQLAGLAAEDPDQFLVDDLDDLLGRVEGTGDLGSPRTLLDAADELPHHGQRNVRLQ